MNFYSYKKTYIQNGIETRKILCATLLRVDYLKIHDKVIIEKGKYLFN